MKIITEALEKALLTLKEAWAEYQKDTCNTFVRDSVVQRFEYTFELSHKMLRKVLSETESSRAEISEMFFNDLIRLGCRRGLLLNDLETWDKYRKARNYASHNYDEFYSGQIMAIINTFIEEIDYELAKIKERLNQAFVMLNIEEAQLKTVLSIIKGSKELENCSVYLFGSRIQGKSVKYSDLDIAIDNQGKPVSDTVRSNLISLFENSILPYKVDIIDINTVSQAIWATIEKDYVRLI